MSILSRSLMLCSLMAVFAFSEPSFSKNLTEQVAQNTEIQLNDKSKTDKHWSPAYFKAACSCIKDFATEAGTKGGKYLMTQALQHAPKIIEVVCRTALLATICDEDLKCDMNDAMQLEKFADEYYGKCS